jgi:hypothetical protein
MESKTVCKLCGKPARTKRKDDEGDLWYTCVFHDAVIDGAGVGKVEWSIDKAPDAPAPHLEQVRAEPEYDPRDPKVQAEVADLMANHQHQYACAICGNQVDADQLARERAEEAQLDEALFIRYNAPIELGNDAWSQFIGTRIGDLQAQFRQAKKRCEMRVEVGDTLYGYCHGVFGRDSYGDKLVVAVAKRWVVVIEDVYGEAVYRAALNLDVHKDLADCLVDKEVQSE